MKRMIILALVIFLSPSALATAAQKSTAKGTRNTADFASKACGAGYYYNPNYIAPKYTRTPNWWEYKNMAACSYAQNAVHKPIVSKYVCHIGAPIPENPCREGFEFEPDVSMITEPKTIGQNAPAYFCRRTTSGTPKEDDPLISDYLNHECGSGFRVGGGNVWCMESKVPCTTPDCCPTQNIVYQYTCYADYEATQNPCGSSGAIPLTDHELHSPIHGACCVFIGD